MAIELSSISKSTKKEHYKAFLFGVEGSGKTTFATHAPAPLFACAEDGLNADGVSNIEIKTYADMIDLIGALYKGEHEFKTLVVDSLTAFEPMLNSYLCERERVDSIDKVGGGFAKYRTESLPLWLTVLSGLDALHKKGMNIIVIGHSQSKEVRLPDAEPFQKYEADLINPKAANMMYRWADIVAFANYRIHVTTDDGVKKTGRGLGTGERVMFLEERPAFHAKNRFDLPPELPFDYTAFSTAMAAPSTIDQPTEGA